MKHSKSSTHCHFHKIPALRFETQALTSFAGAVIIQALFARLGLKEKLRSCFNHLKLQPIFGHHVVVLTLVVHLLLGFRELRDSRYYRDDPLVQRLLGLKRLPDVATISRALASADPKSVEKLRGACRQLVLDRLQAMRPARLTLDFDGSVLSTQRAAEGSAVGFNKVKKGARSYYPLFCTVAQTGQVFDFAHRPGNVHDSHSAEEFMLHCLGAVVEVLPAVKLEVRLDSAFFSEKIIAFLDDNDIEYTVSVPFERFVELKSMIKRRRDWHTITEQLGYFENQWKPKSWTSRARFVFIRQAVKERRKGPIQLDLFVPVDEHWEYKVVVTNKTLGPAAVLDFHNGRGSQETIFGQLKTQCQADYVPVRRLVGNQIFLSAAVLAHNLGRELQMATQSAHRVTTPKRAPLWVFQELHTIRRNLFLRAGRLTNPKGQLTLTISANPQVRTELLHLLDALASSA